MKTEWPTDTMSALKWGMDLIQRLGEENGVKVLECFSKIAEVIESYENEVQSEALILFSDLLEKAKEAK